MLSQVEMLQLQLIKRLLEQVKIKYNLMDRKRESIQLQRISLKKGLDRFT
jgi:hypothetical protein